MIKENKMHNKVFPEGVALVIGGSGGTGSAICQEFARAGTDVVLTYHQNKNRALEVKEKIETLNQQAHIAKLSIGDVKQVRDLINELTMKHRIHTIVFAAGSDIKQPLIRNISPDEWKQVIDADLNGFFNVVHHTLPHMKESGGGSYVHISSAGLHRWPERDALSVAPKAAIESLIQGIAKEEGIHNIRANSVAIGVINAGIFKRLWADGTFDKQWEEAVQKDLCLKRWGKPEEVAHAVVWLASDKAAYTTGQIISVDGGYGV